MAINTRGGPLLGLALWFLAPGARADGPPDRAEAYYHYSLAQQARLAGDGEEALRELREARRLDPGSAAIRAELARQLRDGGQLDQALVEAREAVAADKDDVAAHRILAQLYQAQVATEGEAAFRKAAAEYEEVVRLDPTDGHAMLILGSLYDQLEAHADGARIWQQYLRLDPGSFEAHVRLADHLTALGEADKATAALDEALRLEPSSTRALAKLGEIQAQAGKTAEAVDAFRKALAADPQDLRVRLQLGDVLFGTRRYDEALAEADAVLATDGKNRFGLDLRGRSLRELGRHADAEAAADKSLSLDPNDLRAAFLKVTIAEARRDYAAAAAGLEQILARPRSGGDAGEASGNRRVFLARLGLAYQRLERYEDAARAFKQACETTGQPEPELIGLRLEALLQAKQFDTAVAEARTARASFAKEIEFPVVEALALHEKGEREAALEVAGQAWQLAAGDARALAQVARFHQRARRYDDARQILEAARALDAKNLGVLFQLGAVLERQKRPAEAEAVFRDALAVAPDSAPVLNYLGYMNADRGVKLEESLQLLQKAVSLEPDNGAYLDSLGWALYRLDRIEEAEATLRRAVSLEGRNAVVLDHYGDVLKRQGRVQEAVAHWKRALEGEDEDGDLDRARVETKIRDAQLGLDAQNRR